MKEVALVGLASDSVHHALNLPHNGEEVWSLNVAKELHPGLNLTRLFDMHQPWLMKSYQYNNAYGEPLDHWGWLQEKHPFPIYTLEAYPFIPSSVGYPFNDVASDLFGKLRRGDELASYFGSSFNFMLGLAIHERFERVSIYGFEMATFSEFAYQKAAAEAMIGIALGRGIEVVLLEESRLMKAKVYGYTDAQMMTRRRLTQMQKFYHVEEQRYQGFVNVLQGRIIERSENGGNPTALQAQAQNAAMQLYLNKGASLAIEKMMLELDEHKEQDLTLQAQLVWEEGE